MISKTYLLTLCQYTAILQIVQAHVWRKPNTPCAMLSVDHPIKWLMEDRMASVQLVLSNGISKMMEYDKNVHICCMRCCVKEDGRTKETREEMPRNHMSERQQRPTWTNPASCETQYTAKRNMYDLYHSRYSCIKHT
jgi:hypothetical protein